MTEFNTIGDFIGERKQSITKGFGGDDLEKGKALPVGTIKKRGPNNFIKTASGWKYHSRVGRAGVEKPEKQEKVTKVTLNPNVNLVSFEGLQGKELDVKSIKKVEMASGPLDFYVVEHGGKEYEINSQYVTPVKEGGKEMKGVKVKGHGTLGVDRRLDGKISIKTKGRDKWYGVYDGISAPSWNKESDLDILTTYFDKKNPELASALKEQGGKVIGEKKEGGFHLDIVKRKIEANQSDLKKVNDQIAKNLKAVRDTKALGRNPVYAKKQVDKSYRLQESIERDIGKLKHGETYMRSILKNNNLSASTGSGTAIRGYKRYSSGYDLSNIGEGRVAIRGASASQLDKVVQDAEAKGFKVSNIKAPSKVVGGGSISSFTVDKII